MEEVPPTQSQLSERFMASFTSKKNEITSSLQELIGPQVGELNINDRLTELTGQVQDLSKRLHDAIMYLPPYSIKMRQNEIRELEKALKIKEDELIPKKKFGFMSKSKTKVEDKNCDAKPEEARVEAPAPLGPLKISEDSNFVTVENLESTVLVLDSQKVSKTDVLVRNLKNVKLYLHGSPSTLRISSVQNCKILCGPVHTSVFVECTNDSLLFLCCQQLRTHSSERTDIYLRVRSRAIIEDCKRIRFGPYHWDHPLSKELHDKAQIDIELERFDAVDDFNWLSASQSPNWSIIPLQERVTFPPFIDS